VEIRERTEHVPAAAADFTGANAFGRINAWVSGEVDFEIIATSDGRGLFWRHVRVGSFEALKDTYRDFIDNLDRHIGHHGPTNECWD
jgi:hypothetical protein